MASPIAKVSNAGSPADEPSLHLTGERTLPGITAENYWFKRHVAGYEFAARIIVSAGAQRILDSGCGEGYGAALLKRRTPNPLGLFQCTAIDCFEDALRHGRMTYDGIDFVKSDATVTAFAPRSFDGIVSLQVIEHLADPAAYVCEIRSILDNDGVLVCATPNRLTFTPPGRPKNPFHTIEFDAEELASLLKREFGYVQMLGLVDRHPGRHPGLADALIDSAFADEPPPNWASAVVATVESTDFEVVAETAQCLDLVAICRP